MAVRPAGLVLLLLMSCGLCGCGDQLEQQRERSKENLKRISRALHQYHEEYNSFPPAYVVGDDNQRWHSWRVLILPYLGEPEKELYSHYRFDEPWNGPHNAKLAPSIPEVFASPYADAKPNTTPYLVPVGRRTMWPGPFCCKIRDVTDGMSNTVLLLENPESERQWMEPVDLTHREAQTFYKHRSAIDRDEGAFAIAMGDGRAVFFTPSKAGRTRFHGLLTPRGGAPLVSAELLPDEELELPDFDFPAPQDSATARQTLITPHLEGKLTPEQNHIYCATFQLAWDELRKKCGGQEVQLDPPSAMAEPLNRNRFPPQSLAPECYLAMSGSHEEIREAMSERFPDFTPRLTPPAELVILTCYAYLEKRLPFDEEFDVFEKPLSFGSGKEAVKGFGLKPTETDRDTGGAILESQVEVLDYVDDDDFILRLSTVGPQQDQILLAKVQPGETLQQTLDAVLSRVEKPHPHHTRRHLETVDTLTIPIVLFNYERNYHELTDRVVKNGSPFSLDVARQMIQFRLDETGGLLLSEAEIGIYSSFDEPKPPPPPKPRHFIFDQPFLMVLQEKEATAPYLVAWIANAEVLEKPSQPAKNTAK